MILFCQHCGNKLPIHIVGCPVLNLPTLVPLWGSFMKTSIDEMVKTDIGSHLPADHFRKTPDRVVASYEEIFSGCFLDPMMPLVEAMFCKPQGMDEMITVKGVSIYSMCAHHFLPFFGYATFAYVPDDKIVGLSKIPRFIEILTKRPQVQEVLTQQIVDVFSHVIQPAGCAVMIRAYHLCQLMRGIQEPIAYMETTALQGVMAKGGTKQEFLQAAQATPIWGGR
jgi:GTP cyclohydrolase I